MATYAPAAKNAAIHAGEEFLRSFGNNLDDDENQNHNNQKINNPNQQPQQQQNQKNQQTQQQQPQQQQQSMSRQTFNNRNANNNGQTYRSDTNTNQFMRYNEGGGGENEGQGQRSLSLEYGKTIKLLRNGDEFYRGHKMVINSRKYRYLDVFLDDISDHLQANFGAVRSIHTPINGHRIKNLEQIENGKTYVAAGNGRFIKLKYFYFSSKII